MKLTRKEAKEFCAKLQRLFRINQWKLYATLPAGYVNDYVAIDDPRVKDDEAYTVYAEPSPGASKHDLGMIKKQLKEQPTPNKFYDIFAELGYDPMSLLINTSAVDAFIRTFLKQTFSE